MRPEVLAKWGKALRSGKYEQLNGMMRGEVDAVSGKPAMCCLGVLTDLHCNEVGAEWPYNDNATSCLAKDVCEWAFGERVESTEFGYETSPMVKGTPIGFDMLNDGLVAKSTIRKHTFAEIADIAERFGVDIGKPRPNNALVMEWIAVEHAAGRWAEGTFTPAAVAVGGN